VLPRRLPAGFNTPEEPEEPDSQLKLTCSLNSPYSSSLKVSKAVAVRLILLTPKADTDEAEAGAVRSEPATKYRKKCDPDLRGYIATQDCRRAHLDRHFDNPQGNRPRKSCIAKFQLTTVLFRFDYTLLRQLHQESAFGRR
jgi:hypothetical protein